MKFRKKPVVVEAVEWTAEMDLHPEHWVLFGVINAGGTVSPRSVIRTLEGDMDVNVGDWIITGVKGERYPCKPDIFAQTYEPVA